MFDGLIAWEGGVFGQGDGRKPLLLLMATRGKEM